MLTTFSPTRRYLFLAASACLLLLWLSTTAVSTTAAPTDLPPRPTVAPTATSLPTSTPTPPTVTPAPAVQGGFISLHVADGSRTMWSQVQWQDALGEWHDVAGWQGHLDERVPGGRGKTWWVAPEDLGAGPFRWQLFAGEEGDLLGVSEPFGLPEERGEVVVVWLEK